MSVRAMGFGLMEVNWREFGPLLPMVGWRGLRIGR